MTDSQHQDRSGENLLTKEEFKRYTEIINDAEDRYAHKINEWETVFIANLATLFRTYGPTVRVSEKQKEVLDKIEKKIYAT